MGEKRFLSEGQILINSTRKVTVMAAPVPSGLRLRLRMAGEV